MGFVGLLAWGYDFLLQKYIFLEVSVGGLTFEHKIEEIVMTFLGPLQQKW